jgi:hypothetical protein
MSQLNVIMCLFVILYDIWVGNRVGLAARILELDGWTDGIHKDRLVNTDTQEMIQHETKVLLTL